MEFGKLKDISTVDFKIPTDHYRNREVLSTGRNDGKGEIYFGCPSWTSKDWLGKLYPSKLKSAEFFENYTKHFSTIEFNSSHYALPSKSQVEKWVNESPTQFTFCPKVPQEISHWKRLDRVGVQLDTFMQTVAGFEKHLGCSFLQLPPDFGVESLSMLDSFLDRIPDQYPLSIEFRDPSWFEKNEAFEYITKRMEEKKLPMCLTDVAGRRDVLHMRLTSPIVAVRFVGNQLHDTDYVRMRAWAQRIAEWRAQGLEKIFFFLHQPEDRLCPETAVYFVECINDTCGVNLPIPKLYQSGIQTSLF